MQKKILVIVESPKKCGTIEKMLGPEYMVKATCGHICEVVHVDDDDNFKPKYKVCKNKKEIVKMLKNCAKKCNKIILATDLDREGEAIAFHIVRELKLPKNTDRIVFNQISKTAIVTAIKNPRKLNEHIFDAYQARVILDRMVGFRISPILWRYIQDKLSAGRCQSPALSIVLDREQHINEFKKESYYNVNSVFTKNIEAKLVKRLNTLEKVNELLKIIKKCNGIITKINIKETKTNPPFPYITSTMQQDASTNLGLSPQISNRVASSLYEKGKITYIRTDLDEISQEAIVEIKELITAEFGDKYIGTIKRKKKKKENQQEAHEAIRPIYIEIDSIPELNEIEQKMYTMIRKRTIQSQMAPKVNEVLEIEIKLVTKKENEEIRNYTFISSLINCKFDGFTVMNNSDRSQNDLAKIMKTIKVGKHLSIIKTTASEQFTKPKKRLTEADLIKMIEWEKIGRPSTFASIIAKLIERKYIYIDNTKDSLINCRELTLIDGAITTMTIDKNIPMEKRKIFISKLGITVCNFLIKNFKLIMDYNYTKTVENKLDSIVNGKLIWHSLIKEQYNIIHPIAQKLLDDKPMESNSKLKQIGNHDGIDYYLFNGRYGWALRWNQDDITFYEKIPDNYNVEDITVSDIKDILPKTLGDHNGFPIIIKNGEWGIYIKHNGKNYSMKNIELTKENAIKAITTPKETNILKEFKTHKILSGKWGPYITNGKVNVKIQGELDINSMNDKKCSIYIKKYKKKKS